MVHFETLVMLNIQMSKGLIRWTKAVFQQERQFLLGCRSFCRFLMLLLVQEVLLKPGAPVETEASVLAGAPVVAEVSG